MRRILMATLAILIAAAAAHALGAGKAPASQPATQPTTKPAEKKVFKSLVEVIAKIPKEHLPSPPPDPQFDEKAKALDAWGRAQLEGAKITMPLRYMSRDGSVDPKTGEFRGFITMEAPRGAPYASHVTIRVDKAAYDRFNGVKEGFVCLVTGDVGAYLNSPPIRAEIPPQAKVARVRFDFRLDAPTFAPVK